MIKTNSKGFTLIELLVVIAIIGILSTIAITSLNSARKKANDASFQSTAASSMQSLTLCCDSKTSADTGILAVAGADICDPDVAGDWPAATLFSAIAVDTQCSSGLFQVTLTNANGNSNLTTAVCNQDGCTFS